MKTFVTRVLAFALLLSAIALGQTFVAGFPSSVGGSSGSSSGDSFWMDAGAGYIGAYEPIANPDGGRIALVLGDRNYPTAKTYFYGTNGVGGTYRGMSFDPALNVRSTDPYDVWMPFTMRATVGDTERAAGRKLLYLDNDGTWLGGTNWNGAGATFRNNGLAVGAVDSYQSVSSNLIITELWSSSAAISFNTTAAAGMDDPTSYVSSAGTFTSGLASGANGFASKVNGVRFDLGTGTNDYLASNGTGVTTPGYFRVGNFSDAGLPLPTSIPGAIAYNTSQGAPVWSDGTAWQSFSGSGGSDTYWFDGGAGSIQANVYGLALVRDAGGSTFNFIFEDSTTANNGQLRFIPNINPAHTPILQLNGNGDNYQVSIGSNTSNGAALYIAKNASTAGIQMAGAYIASSAPAGQWAFKADVTGAWWQVGAGSTDYMYSDGVGIITPGYWASSAAFSSTPGVRAYAVQPFPASTILYSAAAASGQGAGAISFDTTRQELQVVRNSQFNPLGGPTFDRMGWRTSIPATPTYADGGIPLLLDGGTIYTAPYITSTVYVTQPTITGGSLDTNFLVERNSSPDRNSVNLAGYTYFPLTTAASIAAQAATTQITSQGGGAQSLIPTTGQPSMCSVLRTGDVTTVNYYSGMVDVLNIVGGINTSAHAYFMYVPGTSANWQTCVYDTADHCTTTAVPVVANTRYRLCVYVNAARGYTAYIDGNYVSGSDAFLLPSGLAMAPFTAVETQAAAARALYIGPYEVQYQ